MTAIAEGPAPTYTIAMPEPPDLDALAQRYLELWNDHLRAVAADPAWLQFWSSLIAMAGTGMAQPGAHFSPGGVPWPFAPPPQQSWPPQNWPGFHPAGPMPHWPAPPFGPPVPSPAAGPADDGCGDGDAATRPAPAAPLPDGGGAALDEFASKLALLAERLDSLERRLGSAGPSAAGRGRRRRS